MAFYTNLRRKTGDATRDRGFLNISKCQCALCYESCVPPNPESMFLLSHETRSHQNLYRTCKSWSAPDVWCCVEGIRSHAPL